MATDGPTASKESFQMISPERLAEIGERTKNPKRLGPSDMAHCLNYFDDVPDLLQHIREQEKEIKKKDERIKELEETKSDLIRGLCQNNP